MTAATTAETDKKQAAKLLENYGKAEARFEQNVGQAPAGVGFIGRGLRHSLSLRGAGAVLETEIKGQNRTAVELVLENSNAAAVGTGVEKTAIRADYLIGDRSKWLQNVPVFQKVRYTGVWPGVDVVYYGTHNQLEYDFVAHPGADLNAIRFNFGGARGVNLNEAGDLVIHAGLGDGLGTVEQRRPRVYQKRGGRTFDLASRYVISDGGSIGIAIDGYDASADVVIDPILVYARVIDGRFNNGSGVALDASGNGYFVGQAQIQVSPQVTFGQGYMVKLDPAGVQQASFTFGGTNGQTGATAVALDSAGNIYVTGFSSASNFANGGIQPALADSPNVATDAFLLKFAPAFSVPYISYLGGHGNDIGNAIAVDNSGNAYIAGQTASADFPRTVGGTFHASGTTGFVTKINTAIQNGTGALVYSTFVGGSGTDVANGIVVDGSGNATVGGTTSSSDFAPASGTGYSPAKTTGANVDGFLVTLNSAGTAASYFTYFPFGRIGSIAGFPPLIYATGQTNGNIPTTATGFQLSGGANHAFLSKFNTSVGGANSLLYSTYLGGAGSDAGLGLAVDTAANAYVAGTTNSANFPTTSGAIALPSGSVAPDAFVSVINTNANGANSLTFSTLLGGNNNDSANAVAVDNFGDILLTGNAASSNFPGLAGPGVFALKFGGESVSPGTGSGSNQVFTFNYTDVNGFLDISGAQVVINSALSAGQSCYILFGRGSNQISLASDNGSSFSSATIGAPVVLQNSQCSVIAFLTNQVGSGNTLTLNLSVVFKPGFAGPKNVYTKVDTNGGLSTGYQQLGTYTATVGSQAIQTVSVSPATGSGPAQPFTFTYSDPNGYPDLSGGQVVINSSLTAGGGCYILFGRGNNLVSLADDSGQNFSSGVFGAPTVLQNSQCTVLLANSFQVGTGLNLSATFYIIFKGAFSGTRTIYSKIDDNAGNSSGFKQLGTYTVSVPANLISAVSATPSAGNSISQGYTFTAYDSNGFADINNIQGVVNGSLTGVGSCYVRLDRAGNAIALADDAGNFTLTAPLGSSNILQNSQCIVNAASSSQIGSGNVLSFTTFITFKPGSVGAKNLYARADTNGGATSNFQTFGNITITNPTTFGTLTVTPSAGQGTTQAFTFALSDPNGFADISGGQMVFNPSLVAPGSCYILFGRTTNLITLADDTGGATAANFMTATLGQNTVLQNSQCSLDASKSFQYGTGNVSNLTVFVTFKAAYAGLKFDFSKVDNNSSNTSGYQVVGSWQSP